MDDMIFNLAPSSIPSSKKFTFYRDQKSRFVHKRWGQKRGATLKSNRRTIKIAYKKTNRMDGQICIEWKTAKSLVETLEPMLFLHTTSALMTITPNSVELQSLCREQRSIFRRTFHVPHDCTIAHDSKKHSTEETQKETKTDSKREVQNLTVPTTHIVVNPMAILNSIHKRNPVATKLLPKAFEMCEKQKIRMPAERNVAISCPPYERTLLKTAKMEGFAQVRKTEGTTCKTPDKMDNTGNTDTRPKEGLEISKIEWKWDSQSRSLYQKLNIYGHWQILPSELYQQSLHKFYNLTPLSMSNKEGYKITTHIGPTVNLDFVEMSILASDCKIQVDPDSLQFLAHSTNQ